MWVPGTKPRSSAATSCFWFYAKMPTGSGDSPMGSTWGQSALSISFLYPCCLLNHGVFSCVKRKGQVNVLWTWFGICCQTPKFFKTALLFLKRFYGHLRFLWLHMVQGGPLSVSLLTILLCS